MTKLHRFGCPNPAAQRGVFHNTPPTFRGPRRSLPRGRGRRWLASGATLLAGTYAPGFTPRMLLTACLRLSHAAKTPLPGWMADTTTGRH